jgi:hypothetical protein
MLQNFLRPQRDQPLLLPVDMREWLPEDDLVFVVRVAVATGDLGTGAAPRCDHGCRTVRAVPVHRRWWPRSRAARSPQ